MGFQFRTHLLRRYIHDERHERIWLVVGLALLLRTRRDRPGNALRKRSRSHDCHQERSPQGFRQMYEFGEPHGPKQHRHGWLQAVSRDLTMKTITTYLHKWDSEMKSLAHALQGLHETKDSHIGKKAGGCKSRMVFR